MKPKQITEYFGLSNSTLRNYESEGILSPKRDPLNYREYSTEDIFRLISCLKMRQYEMPLSDIRMNYHESDPAKIAEYMEDMYIMHNRRMMIHYQMNAYAEYLISEIRCLKYNIGKTVFQHMPTVDLYRITEVSPAGKDVFSPSDIDTFRNWLEYTGITKTVISCPFDLNGNLEFRNRNGWLSLPESVVRISEDQMLTNSVKRSIGPYTAFVKYFCMTVTSLTQYEQCIQDTLKSAEDEEVNVDKSKEAIVSILTETREITYFKVILPVIPE